MEVSPYFRTATFTGESVPDKFTKAHSTKGSVWGRLNVLSREVGYHLKGQDAPLAVIAAGETFVILPEEWHYVRLSEDASFFVEFCR